MNYRQCVRNTSAFLMLMFAVTTAAIQKAEATDTQINTYSTSHQQNSVIASDSSGNFVVAWQSYGQDGSGFGIFARRYSSAGYPLGSEFQVNTATYSSQLNPDLAMDRYGRFVIVWQDISQGTYCIRAQRFNSDGSRQGSEFQVSASGFNASSTSNPSISMSPSGQFVVVWQRNDQYSNRNDIYAQRYSVDAFPLGSEFKVNTTTDGDEHDSSVALSNNGNFVVAWTYSPVDANGYWLSSHVRTQLYNSAGSPIGNEYSISDDMNYEQALPSLAINDTGNYLVTWSGGRNGIDADSDVYAQKFSSTGTSSGSEFRVNTTIIGAQIGRNVSMNANGDFVIAWDSDEPNATGYRDCYLQRFGANNDKQGAETQVNTYTANNQQMVAVALDSSGNTAATWSSSGQDGSGWGVYFARFSPAPRPPVAVNDTATFDEDTGGPIPVLANDSDPDKDTLTITDVSAAANGTTSIISGNTGTTGIYYMTKPNYHGPDSFTYTISDGHGGIATATVNVTVNSVNDWPVGSYQMFYGTEDVSQSFSLNASDVDNDPLVYTITQAPTNGTLSGTMPNLVYTPNPNYYGPEVIEFRVTDPSAAFADGRVIINLTAVRDPGLAIVDTKTVAEDSDWTNINVMANDQDVDHVEISLWGITPTSQQGGSVRMELDGTVSYKPAANFNGTDTFSYTIHDGYGLTSTTTVTVTVTPVNDAPVSSTQSVTTNEDTATAITLSATDIEGDALTYYVVTPPTKGTLSGSGANLVYTPGANLNGSDSFTFKANDGKADSSPVAVNISIAPVNDAPVAVKDVVSTSKNVAKTILVTANDTDVDGDILTVTSVTRATNGTVALSGSGSITYTPKRNFVGTDTFSYTISDGKGGTATAVVAVTITR